MPTINSIEAGYRLYLSRLSKQSTRKDYTMRFNVFLTWCSMERYQCVEEVDFPQFLDYVFLARGVSPRTHNNNGVLFGSGRYSYGNEVGDMPRVEGTRTQDCFNVYGIDTVNKIVKVVRVGSTLNDLGQAKDMDYYPYEQAPS